jgi:CRISPR system Cascade subunit CasE
MSYLTMIPADTLRTGDKTIHQTVMSFFPAELPGDPAARRAGSNILFTLDNDSLLIRSDIAPTRAPANARTLLATAVPETGTVVRFRLTVNAVRRGRSGGVTPVDDIETWIAAKLSPALSELTVLRHARALRHTGDTPLQVDTLDGQAVIADDAELETLLRAGVGRAKAYGCGLMLVAA